MVEPRRYKGLLRPGNPAERRRLVMAPSSSSVSFPARDPRRKLGDKHGPPHNQGKGSNGELPSRLSLQRRSHPRQDHLLSQQPLP